MAASEFCKSMSALIKSILRLLIVLDPLKQISADLNKAKEVHNNINDNNNNNNNNKITLHKMACIRTLPQVVHSQYIYWYKTNIRMWQDV